MKRLWGVRHVRAMWWAWRLDRWVRQWSSVGIGLRLAAESDRRFIRDIWEGRA